MLDLPIGRLLASYQKLTSYMQFLKSHLPLESIQTANDQYQFVLDAADEFCDLCGKIGFLVTQGVTVKACDMLRRVKTEGGVTTTEHVLIEGIYSALYAVTQCLNSESAITVAITLPPASRPLYEQKHPVFGHEVAQRFPTISYDIAEAGKCLALGRSTAAAFHSIRCLEAGFAAIWRSLGIADPIAGFERNWKNRLEKVNKEMESRWPAKSGRMTADAKFYDAIVGSYQGMQNPYRNNTMHFDAVYTQEDANHIFELSKGILRQLAARMDENGNQV